MALYEINKEETAVKLIQNDTPISVQFLPHQEKVIKEDPHRLLIAFDTGTGKTITALSLVNNEASVRPKDLSLLVIVPKTNVKQWAEETLKYVAKGYTVHIISKEYFKKHVRKINRYQSVIIDEGHYFAGKSSDLSKCWQWYLKQHNPKRIYLCTATPYCSTPWNIYTLARHLGIDWNYRAFEHKFFHHIPMGARSVPVAREGMEEELRALVHKIGVTVSLGDVVEVPEQTDKVVRIPLTEDQLKGIEDDTFDPVFIVRWTRAHQIENGFLYGDEILKDRVYDSNKTNEVIKLCRAHKKIIIVAKYTAQLELYKKILEQNGYKVGLLSGQTKNRHELIQEAEKAESYVFLMQASCSAGFELPSFPVMVFASLSFSHVDHIQARGRILRVNRLKENAFIYLVTDGVDRDVYNCIMEKKDFSIKIYTNEK